MVERCFWEQYDREGKVYPDPGGMLDQDDHLMADLATYSWIVGFANAILDKEEADQKEAAEVLAKARQRRS